ERHTDRNSLRAHRPRLDQEGDPCIHLYATRNFLEAFPNFPKVAHPSIDPEIEGILVEPPNRIRPTSVGAGQARPYVERYHPAGWSIRHELLYHFIEME